MEKSVPEFSDTNFNLINNLSIKIKSIYEGIDCESCSKSFCNSCLNSIRQGLEYLCLFTCQYYKIRLLKRSKSGELIDNDNPTLGDMAPLIESYFKENGLPWSKEVGTHIGSIWILGNLGSHAQKDMITDNTEINRETIINAKNSMYVVTKWFYSHFDVPCPIAPLTAKFLNNKSADIAKIADNLLVKLNLIEQNKSRYLLIEEEPVLNEFSDIYWDELVEAIGSDSCVLFIGQDIFINKDGESLHKIFYDSVEGRNIRYNSTDGFFMPGSDKQLRIKAINYYSKEFHEKDSLGHLVLKMISQIPFSLIISVTPDDSIHKIWSNYNKNHNFLFYNGQKQETKEPTKEFPTIYNLLGNASKSGTYIFTHEQFYAYLNEKKEVKVPLEIETKVKDAIHYLFLGIDFNKWHNRLLLFCLSLNGEGYSLNNQSIDELNQSFVLQQFKVSSIKTNYLSFTNILLQKCKDQGFYKPLIETFIENTKAALEEIKKAPNNEIHPITLNEIEDKINSILNE
jgi:hypothetical protein